MKLWKPCTTSLKVNHSILALLVLHSHKIIHKDLKSPNVLLCRNEKNEIVYKLGDLNVASVLSDSDKNKMLSGTPFYIPPEVFTHKIQNY